jgi:GntR family transcriptional regulator
MPKVMARPLKLQRGTSVPAHVQIEQWLLNSIASGELAAGDRLPPERDFAAALGVSRMTLRQSLDMLQRRGLLTRTIGRRGGTFVGEPKVECDLTTLIGFSEQLRRRGMTAGARVVSAAEEQADPSVAKALGLSEGAPVYLVVRVRLANDRPLLLERSHFPAERFPGLLDEAMGGSLYELLEKRYGQRPRRAIESLESVSAGPLEARLLEVPKGTALMLIERTAYGTDGVPVEFARDTFRGDRTRIVVWSDIEHAL